MSLIPAQEIADRLSNLRSQMTKHSLDAYLVPSEDAHQVFLIRSFNSKSEYIASHDKRRTFITGFSGSAGYALITQKHAYLWTDGRYFLQASKELPPFIHLMKLGNPDTLSVIQIAKEFQRIGVDGKLVSLADSKNYSSLGMVYMKENLIDVIWKDQPSIPCNPIIPHLVQYCGQPSCSKIENFVQEMITLGLDSFVITTLDEIAWLFNLRGSDIPFNPVFFSYCIVEKDFVVLYTDSQRSLETNLHVKHAIMKPYSQIFQDMPNMTGRVGVDPRCNKALFDLIPTPVVTKSPIQLMKAIKNSVETSGFEACHKRDAAALVSHIIQQNNKCNFFGWLGHELKTREISEVDAADRLELFRAEQAHFMGLSFSTIAGSGPNGAIIHYKPERETCSYVNTKSMFLLDSGGQYLDGTTDVTRTVHYGIPSNEEKKHYTLVLKSHIAIDTVEFPVGTSGFQLDVVARTGMWKHGLDYKHGTGHGVGFFLNVHEGPHGINTRVAYNEVPLKEGMIVTNEPGLYFEGKYGIRIENVVKCVSVRDGFLGFLPVTVVPMDRNLIDLDLLTPDEIKWVDSYHRKCYESVYPLLDPNGLGALYLKEAVKPLVK